MKYEGKQIKIVPYKSEDQDYLMKVLSENPNGFLVSEILHDALKSDLKEIDEYHKVWTVECDCKSGEKLGTIVLQKMSHQHKSAELIVIFDDPDFYADSKAIENVLNLINNEAFNNLDFVRLQAVVLETHLKLKKAYKDSGYVEEGLLRSKFEVKDKRYDAYVMSLLKIDWGRGEK